MMPSIYSCPSCASENTQKSSLAYKSGVRTSARSNEALMFISKPPKKKSLLWLVVALVIFIPACLLFDTIALVDLQGDQRLITKIAGDWLAWSCAAISTAATVTSIILIRSHIKFNKTRFPSLSQGWDKQYLCLRCSNRFLVENSLIDAPQGQV